MNYDYRAEALRIIELLKRDFVLDSGLLALKRVSSKKSPHHILPDLGDYLPFFLYFGEDRFAEIQIRALQKLAPEALLRSEFPAFKIHGLAKSYEYTDLVLGLIDYYGMTMTTDAQAIALQFTDAALNFFKLDSRPSSFYFPPLRLHIPLIDSRDGTFIEILLAAYDISQDEKYLQAAKNIHAQLTSSSFFKKEGLLPTFIPANQLGSVLSFLSPTKFTRAEICKANTNSLFAFLELYQLEHDPSVLQTIMTIVENIRKKATVDGGGVATAYIPGVRPTIAHLTPSFALMEFLCDLFSYTKNDDTILFAEEIARFWIGLQGHTGLFPVYSNTARSFLDSETDMFIALSKLHEITRNDVYQTAADRCFEGIIQFHAPHDYVLSVAVDTGAVVDAQQKTKFISLFLKALIYQIERGQGATLYGNKKLFNLLKDR